MMISFKTKLRISILLLILAFSPLTQNAFSQGFKWSTSGGVVGNSGSAGSGALDIARDSNGNLYTFSNSNGDQQCQGDTVIHIGSTVLANAFIYKFNQEGELVWLKAIGPEFYPNAIEVDGNGNVYVLGRVISQFTIGTSDTTININGSYFIIKFNSDGEFIWVHNTGMPGTGGTNNSSLLKTYQDRIYFQSGASQVACIDTSGLPVLELNATYYNPTTALQNIWFKNAARFSNGDFLFCGEHTGQLSFGEDTLPSLPGEAALNRLFYIRCTPDFNITWFRSFGSFMSSSAYPTGLTIGENDEIYTSVMVPFSTPVVFGPDSIFNSELANGIGAITRINSAGEPIWIRSFSSNVSPTMGGLTVSANMFGIWFCGTNPGNITLGNTTLQGSQNAKGFIAHMNPSGQVTRAFSYGTPPSIQSYPQAFTSDGEGEYYVSGFISGFDDYTLSCQNYPANFGITVSAFTGDPDEVPAPEIVASDLTLTAEPEFFGNIQWFFEGEEIPGATGQSIEATNDGNYSVLYSYDFGCEGEAASEVFFVSMGLNRVNSKKLMVYPNPASEFIYLKGLNENSDFILVNSVGSMVAKGELSNEAIINIANLSPGIYFLTIPGEGLSARFIVIN
jgi:hypothetical protein